MEYLALLIPVAGIGAAVYFAIRRFRRTGSGLRAMKVNLAVIGLVFVVALVAPLAARAAEDTGEADATVTSSRVDLARDADEPAEAPAAAPTSSDNSLGLGMIAVALSIGLAGIGGGIAVASAAPAAIGATSEDPAAFGKAMIFVALGEAIALYGLVVSIMILGKF